jgi:integrase
MAKRKCRKPAKHGKAHVLQGPRWQAWLKSLWLKSLKKECHARAYLAIYLTNAMCVRITQAYQLEAADFDFGRSPRVWFKPFKRHVGAWKPMLPSVLKEIQAIRKNGLKADEGDFSRPKAGNLFPSRKGSKLPHLNKDVVSHAIVAGRTAFIAKHKNKWPDLVDAKQKIKSLSGRRHAITKFAGADLPMHIGMAWAQITSPRVYAGYCDLTPECVATHMAKFDKSSKIGKA